MNDPRDIKLAQMLVNYSVRIQPGEKVLIDYTGEECVSLVKRIVREVYAAAGVPFVKCDHPIVTREFLMGCSEEQVKIQDDADLYLMKQMDAYIGIRAAANAAARPAAPPPNITICCIRAPPQKSIHFIITYTAAKG